MFFIVMIIAMAVLVTVVIIRNSSGIEQESVKKRNDETGIKMSWWGNDSRHKYTMEGIDIFKENNPDINVEYRYGEWSGYEKRTKVWMESHTEADVMQINYAWLEEYSNDGKGFYDLNELSDYIDLNNFTEDELAYGIKNGKLNALPIAMNTHTFYYNQDVLDKYGLTVPKTWDDIIDMGKVLAEHDLYVLGMSKKQLFLMLVAYYEQTYGEKVFKEDGSLNIDADDLAHILEFYKEMIDEHALCPIDVFDRNKYMSGEIAGTMCWISDTKIYCDGLAETGAKVTRAAYPKASGAKYSGWYIKPATMWAISAETAHPKEAAMLLNYLLNDPAMARLQKTEKGVPVSDAAVKALEGEGLFDTNEYKAMQEMMEHQEELYLMIPNMENEKIIDVFKSEADEYLFDKMSLEECAQNTYAAMKEIADGKTPEE